MEDRPAFAALIGIALGGGVGALLRHGLGGAVQRAAGAGFPWGTLVVNLLGCLAIGALAGLDGRGVTLPHGVRLALMVGLLGGFTTFSSLGLEAFRLLQVGEFSRALLYVGVSNTAGLAAVALGYRLVGRG